MKNLLIISVLFFFVCKVHAQKTTENNQSDLKIWEIEKDGYRISITLLDSITFYRDKGSAEIKPESREKITDFATAKKLLKGVVEFVDEDQLDDYHPIRRILFRNGYKWVTKQQSDYAFVAYYPNEEILLCEGGHSTDVSFDLKTGQETEVTGNPDCIVTSPNQHYRLNGFYEGQECFTYFIQQYVNGAFEKVIPLSEAFFRNDRYNICYVAEAFWTDDQTLYLKETLAWDERDAHKSKYYKISVLRTTPQPTSKPIGRSNNPSDFIPEGYVPYSEGTIKGDLNKDGLEDLVLMIKGTDSSEFVNDPYRGVLDRNRRGIIVLLNKGDYYELALSNPDCFSSENEEGGVYFPPDLFLEIQKGNLQINYAHGRYGGWWYTFRYQNRDLELIGYDAINNHGPVTQYTTSVNFLTKKKLTRENLNRHDGELDEKFEETWENISIEEMLRLSEIIDFDRLYEQDLYAKP